jgi:protein-S-isoprenylcysteine O-methyltransferase Ste14
MTVRRMFGSSPRQTFVLFPLAVLLFDAVVRRRVRLDPRALLLLTAGYGLYRYAGSYRDAQGAGSRGAARPPVRLVTDGPYGLTRNPMYLGHLTFVVGLAAATRSPLAVLLGARQLARFRERVRVDEERLERIFGEEYRAYRARVPRWLPGAAR